MPISMLCDRNTTSVPKVQPFFIKTFPLALFKELHNIMPDLEQAVDSLKKNMEIWTDYEETEEDKKVYKK